MGSTERRGRPRSRLRADRARVAAVAFALAAGAAAAAAPHEHPAPVVLAPGYADLAFDAPEPGSYALPPLGAAADGALLDTNGAPLELADLLENRVVVLSFIFTRCSDVNGCPLASYVLARLQEKLAAAPALAEQVRLVSLSFDPSYDTPAVMRAYAARFERPGVDWRFVTTRGDLELEPILRAYDQSVIRDIDENGEPLGTFSHVLRVYLIDRSGMLRNIYSVSYLHADTVMSDILTVLGDGGD